LSPDIIFILSYKKFFIDIHKLAHFPIPGNSKIVRQQYQISDLQNTRVANKTLKFCYQQIWTPLLQNKDTEIFTKKKSQLDSLKITRPYKALLDIHFLKINVSKATIFTKLKKCFKYVVTGLFFIIR